MADDTQASISADAPQPAPVPSAEQQVTESVEVSGDGLNEQSPATETSSDLELPQGVSERTREQFEKLKRQLSEYKERLFGEQNFRSMRPDPVAQTNDKPLYDQNTGLVDVQALNELQRRAGEADTRARRAEEAVQSYLENLQTREAYSSHPELDPKGKRFDENLNRMTRAVLMDSMAYPESYGGKTLSFKEAADAVKTTLGKSSVQESSQEIIERVTSKEQASLGATGRPTPGIARLANEADRDRLRVLTRKGDVDAMVARMNAISEDGRK